MSRTKKKETKEQKLEMRRIKTRTRTSRGRDSGDSSSRLAARAKPRSGRVTGSGEKLPRPSRAKKRVCPVRQQPEMGQKRTRRGGHHERRRLSPEIFNKAAQAGGKSHRIGQMTRYGIVAANVKKHKMPPAWTLKKQTRQKHRRHNSTHRERLVTKMRYEWRSGAEHDQDHRERGNSNDWDDEKTYTAARRRPSSRSRNGAGTPIGHRT